MSFLNPNVTQKDDDVISVSQLNKLAKSVLENHLPIMWIRGEISGLKSYSHLYFDLKDEGAKISCVMFAKLAAMVDFNLENGLQVEVRGRVTLYPQNGSYQINVERVRKVGLGELWEAYNRLIVKLRAEGLFEAKYKKALPFFPKAVGVITSKEGAVIRDVVTTLKRRMPGLPIVVYHSAVQGSDAAMQICRAIRTANQRNEVDVLIVCRGGGSMEDLWCFNEEVVAREVFSSSLPIISAVGHETDTTIIDFVSDLRAPTPTAAAELVTKSIREWLELIYGYSLRLNHSFEAIVNDKQQQLDLLQAHLKAANPLNKLKEQSLFIAQLANRLNYAFERKLSVMKNRLNICQSRFHSIKFDTKNDQHHLQQLTIKLQRAIEQFVHNKSQQLNYASKSLELLNPTAILRRGYAIVQDVNGKVIHSIKQAKHHAKVQINLADGKVSAIIDKQNNPEQAELI